MRKEKSEKNVGYNPVARFFLMLFFAVMAILILIPLLVLFGFVQKLLVKSMTLSGMAN